MFPTGYFAPAYFTPEYFPRPEVSVAPARVGGAWSVVNRHIAAIVLQEMIQEQTLLVITEQQKQELAQRLFARQVEWNLEQEYQVQLVENAMYAVLLIEL